MTALALSRNSETPPAATSGAMNLSTTDKRWSRYAHVLPLLSSEIN
jgi:hypothetical protein